MKQKKRKKNVSSIGFKVMMLLINILLSTSSCTAKCSNECGIDDDTYLTSVKQKRVLPSKTILKKVSKSTTIIAYAIDALSEDTISEKIHGFCTIGQPKPLKAKQIEQIKAIIANDSTYIKKDNIIKYSSFLPDYAFKFITGKDSVVVFLDFHADMWLFKYKKREYLLDNDIISPSLRKLVGDIFHIQLKVPQKAKTSQNSVQEEITAEIKIEEKKETDTLKYKKLPSNIVNIINNADSLKCYILDPLADKKIDKTLGKYVVLLEKKMVNKTVIDDLRKQLLNNKSFPDYMYVKNCTFLPDVAFVFYHNNDKLNILFSFYCNECQMVLNNKLEFQNDCELIQSSIIKIARKIFPKDKYLRTIK